MDINARKVYVNLHKKRLKQRVIDYRLKKCVWGGDISHAKSMYYLDYLRNTESWIPHPWVGT